MNVCDISSPKSRHERVTFPSLGDEICGLLVFPDSATVPPPVLIISHGAGEFKENYIEMADYLATRGIASLALDMHGHGESKGVHYQIDMREWSADISAALDFLETRSDLDAKRVGALGLSSGGTAILEAAVHDQRLKALVALDATVMNTLPLWISWFMKSLSALGSLKRMITGTDIRISLVSMLKDLELAADPEINAKLRQDPGKLRAFMAFPLPGAKQAFIVDTIKRVPSIKASTLVIWGAEDKLDPVSTGEALFAALTCKKALEIVPGNGHVGHLDRNRHQVFDLTARWLLEHLTRPSCPQDQTILPIEQCADMRMIVGKEAKNWEWKDKWGALSPHLTKHGTEALAFATLQQGMEYFVHDLGYIAFTTVTHPVFARKPKRIVLSDPVCAPDCMRALIEAFVAENSQVVFTVISEFCARLLRQMGFQANTIGYEPQLDIQSYNTAGNWKELDMIKRARNEATREKISIREVDITTVPVEQLDSLSSEWIGGKKVNDREIWIYARRPVYHHEDDVRKFVAFDKDGLVVGYVFYDPMYRDGKVYGYSANIVRCNEKRYGRLATAIHMTAMDTFKPEGKEVLNLLLCPFVNLDDGAFNDDWGSKVFFELSARYGNDIYNFTGLSFHKSKYRGVNKCSYFASNGPMPSNDIYLAFLSSDIANNYFATVGKLLKGVVKEVFSDL